MMIADDRVRVLTVPEFATTYTQGGVAEHSTLLSLRASGFSGGSCRGWPVIMEGVAATLLDMSTWTGRTGEDQLRSFVAEDGNFWLEQNPHKTSKWSKLARAGHAIAWEFGANRRYTGRMLIDGALYSPSEATTKFLK